MYNHWIEFPKLGIRFDDMSLGFKIGSLDIRWYSILIATGFILAILYAMNRGKKEYKINTDHFLDVVLVSMLFAIIGARLYYVIFSWDSYKDNPISALYIWEGGIAIYGGLIGGLVSGILLCKWRKIKIGSALDLAGLGLLIGQGIGRWGNFVNQEAFGTNTDLPWGMTGDIIQRGINASGYDTSLPVHPCFLYESLWCLIGFVILHLLTKKRKFDGQIFIGYLAWYGLGRFFIEGLRTDSLYLPGTNIRASQLLAAILVIASIAVNFIILGIVKKKAAKAQTAQISETAQPADEAENSDDVKADSESEEASAEDSKEAEKDGADSEKDADEE